MTQQCYEALDSLMRAAVGSYAFAGAPETKVFIPYIGTLAIRHSAPQPLQSPMPTVGSARDMTSQPDGRFAEGLSEGGLGDGFGSLSGLGVFDMMDGAEVYLEDPSYMFDAPNTGSTETQEDRGGSTNFEPLTEEMADIDGDWGMLVW
jgi:hypothetical protein